MAKLTFFQNSDYYESLLDIAEDATKAGSFDAAWGAINNCEKALNECKNEMEKSFDLFWARSNELNDVIRNLATAAGKECQNLQKRKVQLTVDVNYLKDFLKEHKPQLFLVKYQEEIEILKMELKERFSTALKI
jgi:hypothetical protein